jgi:hypothetical protein
MDSKLTFSVTVFFGLIDANIKRFGEIMYLLFLREKIS